MELRNANTSREERRFSLGVCTRTKGLIEQQKMTEGKALVKFFCVPYDTVDGVPQFHNPKDYPDKWEIFKAYNKRDVGAELEIDRRLSQIGRAHV